MWQSHIVVKGGANLPVHATAQVDKRAVFIEMLNGHDHQKGRKIFIWLLLESCLN